jgi:deoxycytidylate deaminase
MVNEFSELAPPDPKGWWIDKMYMQAAFSAARHSTDLRTQVGCTLVIPTQGPLVSAWNAVPESLLAAGYPLRPEDKNYCTEHAERRVIYKATLNGLPVRGLHLYGTWAACAECARTVIEFGVQRVVTSSVLLERTPDRWRDSVLHGLRMMRDAGIQVVGWRGELSLPIPIRFNSEAVFGADLA